MEETATVTEAGRGKAATAGSARTTASMTAADLDGIHDGSLNGGRATTGSARTTAVMAAANLDGGGADEPAAATAGGRKVEGRDSSRRAATAAEEDRDGGRRKAATTVRRQWRLKNLRNPNRDLLCYHVTNLD
jgi:hypothetical protein